MLSKTPDLRQRKFVVAVNDGRICFVQLVFGDVPLIDKGYLPPVQTTDGARGLGWAEIETVARWLQGNALLRWLACTRLNSTSAMTSFLVPAGLQSFWMILLAIRSSSSSQLTIEV